MWGNGFNLQGWGGSWVLLVAVVLVASASASASASVGWYMIAGRDSQVLSAMTTRVEQG
ncbi:MAG: hypothetical protein JJE28_08205 [Actinomycetales bacterium]|nr:hypothetical protein [Actinomycetales bacterium]